MAWRWNAVLGKAVPVVLLVYMILAYRLVVVDYSYRRIFVGEGRKATAVAFMALLHALFLPSLWAYFRIFLARSVTRAECETRRWTTVFGGAALRCPPIEPPEEILQKRIIFECDALGEPIRCHRDECHGRWKPARARHCGDCRECRVALDHHCPWFDADVSAPQTLLPFLLFLSLVPLLLSSAFLPLAGVSYRHARFIWRHASASVHVDTIWWSRKRSWMGGPMYRWVVGFWLGARECCGEVPNGSIISPNLFMPVMLVLAAGLALIASFLLLSTLLQLAQGDLTIDVEIRKSLRARSTAAQDKAKRFFWVPLPGSSVEGAVVAIAGNEKPYDLGGRKENLRAFLCLTPYTMEQLQQQWPMSPATKAQLIAQAQHQASKDR